MKGLFRYIKYSLLFLIIFEVQAGAHGIPVPVIVDTDMALDDIRAITMLLNSETVQIPLFIASDGVRSPKEGVRNLEAILEYFNRRNERIAGGKKLDKPVSQYRALIKEIKVPKRGDRSENIIAEDSAPEEIAKIIGSIKEPVLYLCLGPLTNLAEALKINPEIKDSISYLLYFGAHPDDHYPGWNSLRDPDAARSVFNSGIKIYAMALPEERLLPFDTGLYGKIRELDTAASRLLEEIHDAPEIKGLMSQNHFYVWDEMTVLYLNDPSLFTFAVSSNRGKVMTLSEIETQGISDAYLKALGYSADAHLSPRQSVVLNMFPKEPSLFRADVSPYVNDIIDRYGLEEWKACLLTNEFHRHLGIYSLVGAKMGVRAREILEAPFDTVEVISHAGNNPPLSCMNDGLQVSTGASLGRGTIQISDQKSSPAAVFIHNNTRLELSLKAGLWRKIQKDISNLLSEYGGLSEDYFSHVRKLSIQYWKDLDRREIFEESMR
ncbi:nucleoside hydrolase [Deltaproteobacteria bacterium]|nr:nucleoside hydrolase [Deltaproteobacteria bacterium]